VLVLARGDGDDAGRHDNRERLDRRGAEHRLRGARH
jgi:hypothetical protein